MTVERLASRYGLAFKGSKQRADVARGKIDTIPVLLAQPLTFMNESGNAVSRLVHYYRIDLDHLLVVCDDMDLPFGRLRFRSDGSAGGQRGLDSIIRSLGSNEFARLRIGVGRPARSAVGHVLGRFSREQEAFLPQLLDVASDAVVAFLTRDAQEAMNLFNRDWTAELLGERT